MATVERDRQNFGYKCGNKTAKFLSLVAESRKLLNSMTNKSKNGWKSLKVVVKGRWSLNLSGLHHEFD